MSEFAMLNALMTPGLTPSAGKVYAYIVGRANGAFVCWASIDNIAADLDLTPRSVMGATKTLRDRGLIKVQRRYKDTNNYFVPQGTPLHDRPRYHGQQPTPAPLVWDDPAEDEKQNVATVDVKKTAPEPDLKKTAVDPTLTCKKAHSDLKKTAQESVQQESIKEDSSLRSVPHACAPAPAHARECDSPLASKRPKKGRALSEQQKRMREVEPEGFDEWFAHYPRQDDRRHAALAYRAACKRGASIAELLSGLQRYRFKDDPNYQPLPTTWLNGDRWKSKPLADFDPTSRKLDPRNLTGPYALAYKLEQEARARGDAEPSLMMLEVANG